MHSAGRKIGSISSGGARRSGVVPVLVLVAGLVGPGPGWALTPDEADRAGQLMNEGQYAEAAELFRRSLASNPDSTDAHLGLARAYLAMGNYARAKIEFERVLRIEDLPGNLYQQVEIYARAAQDYARGERMIRYGFLAVGPGNYRANATAGTDEFGGSDIDDDFFNARGGGGLNYQFSDRYSLSAGLDYRYQNYDADDRPDDRDLDWYGYVNRMFGASNLAMGLRGSNSYLGAGDYRNDYGVFTNWRYTLTADDQFILGAEFLRRDYPGGPESENSHNVAELSLGWTHALGEGATNFILIVRGGREFATNNRPDGDATFYGLSPALEFTLTETLGGFIFGGWQRVQFNALQPNTDAAGDVLSVVKRDDDLYEAGAGLSWQFAGSWSLNPEVLYIYDDSNILANNVSSTQLWATVRKDF